MLSALEYEMGNHWTVERELLAQCVEILDTIRYATFKANGGKNVARPRQVPRPSTMKKNPAKPLSMREYMQEFGKTRSEVVSNG